MATLEEIKAWRHDPMTCIQEKVAEHMDVLIAMVEELETGIQKFLDGDYPHPAAFRHVKDAKGKCPHGCYYWDECSECNDEYLESVLKAAIKGDKS